MEELKIIPPTGYIIDKENSTFECIKFKPKKLTYEDIAKELFEGKVGYYPSSVDGKAIRYTSKDILVSLPNNCVSGKQVEKLMAFNKLINVAKYLNGDWTPDFNDSKQEKWFIIINDKFIDVVREYKYSFGAPCFKSLEVTNIAMEILGGETIKLALSQI